MHATGHQIAPFRCSVCEEEKAQLLNPLMISENFRLDLIWMNGFVYKMFSILSAELNNVIDQLQQGPSRSPQKVLDTTDTSRDETDNRGAVEKSCQKN